MGRAFLHGWYDVCNTPLDTGGAVIPSFVSRLPLPVQLRFPEAYANPRRPIAWGEPNHEAVAVVQLWLDVLSYYPFNPISVKRTGSPDVVPGELEADGIFGNETLEAVKYFQRAHGLRPDGMVGHDTLDQFDIELNRDPKARSIPI